MEKEQWEKAELEHRARFICKVLEKVAIRRASGSVKYEFSGVIGSRIEVANTRREVKAFIEMWDLQAAIKEVLASERSKSPTR